MSLSPTDRGMPSFAVWTYYGSHNLPPIILYWGKTAPGKRISLSTAFCPFVLMIRCASLTPREMTLFCALLEQSQYVLSLPAGKG